MMLFAGLIGAAFIVAVIAAFAWKGRRIEAEEKQWLEASRLRGGPGQPPGNPR